MTDITPAVLSIPETAAYLSVSKDTVRRLITRGELQISVSSGGGSPALVQRVKREVAALIGEEYGRLLELAAEMRAEAKRRVPDFEQRRALLHAFVESTALDLLRAGQSEEAQRIAHE